MHPCLQIVEIQELIVSYASEHTTAQLARVCRTLYEPAMDALWSSIDGYPPLIKCMSSELWTETEVNADIDPDDGGIVYKMVSIRIRHKGARRLWSLIRPCRVAGLQERALAR